MSLYTTASSSEYVYLIDIDITPLKIDWNIIIQDLKERNYAPSRQAISIGKSWSTFQKTMQGSEPSFAYGHALLMLHTKVCGSRVTEQRILQFLQQSIKP